MSDPALDLSTWLDISADALRGNLRILRKRLAEGAKLGAVVKSDAYGHGLLGAARTFVEAGADWLVVNAPAEATALREGGLQDTPVYVCGPILPGQAGEVAAARARAVVYDPQVVAALGAAGQACGWEVPLHVKVETGVSRQGLPASEAVALGRRIAQTPGVRLEGLTTHFADIEDTTDHRFAREQVEAFHQARAAFAEAGLEVGMWHAANSAATILWPEIHGSLTRVGIAAYGLWPSRETYATALQIHADRGDGFVPELRPAMAWRARVAQVKSVPAGAYVGYGRTYRTTHDSRIAVLPVGYYEGYDRRLSNLAHVLIDGVRAPVRGRVCMNMTMVDVTHIPGARAGSVATLLGSDGDETVTAEMLADWMGTINYEVVSRVHPALPRLLR